jgi:hypothetical protein
MRDVYKSLAGNLKGRDHLVYSYIGVNGRPLKVILTERDVKVVQDRVPLRDYVNMPMKFRVLVKRFLIFSD